MSKVFLYMCCNRSTIPSEKKGEYIWVFTVLLCVLMLHSKADKHSIRTVRSVINGCFPVQEATKYWGKTLCWWKTSYSSYFSKEIQFAAREGLFYGIISFCVLICRFHIGFSAETELGSWTCETETSGVGCWHFSTEQIKPFCRKAQIYPVYIYNTDSLGTVNLYTKIIETWSLLNFSCTN